MKSILIKTIKNLFLIFVSASLLVACEKENEGLENPTVNKLEPGEAAGGDVVTITGADLAGIQSIVFDNGNVPASFNPVFNTESAILFRVPDTAYGGDQNVVLTNSLGKQVSFPIKVIALPTIASIFPTDFEEGTELTIIGNNLESVTSVKLVGGAGEATIVSSSRKELVIKMPATDASKVKLSITNASGERTPDISLVNVAQALALWKEDWIGGIDNWGWGGNYTASSDEKITGAASLKADMNGNSWGAFRLHPADPGISLAPYKEVAFWIKGADVETTYAFSLNWAEATDVVVPANEWKYFVFPLQKWKSAGVNMLNDVVFQVKGDGKLVYFDNVVLLK